VVAGAAEMFGRQTREELRRRRRNARFGIAKLEEKEWKARQPIYCQK
jgi:hypothetical protein